MTELVVKYAVPAHLMAAASAFGWAIVFVIHRGWNTESMVLSIICVFAVMLPVAFLGAIAVGWKRKLPVVACCFGMAAITVGLTIALPRLPLPPRFEFLPDRPLIYGSHSYPPGQIFDVYTFKGNVPDVISAAKGELIKKGYKTLSSTAKHDPSKKYTTFWLPAKQGDSWPLVSIVISQGRYVEQSSEVTGHGLEEVDDPNWVTVDVTRVDPVPSVIRMFTP